MAFFVRKTHSTQNGLSATPGGSAAFTDLNNFHSKPFLVQNCSSFQKMLGCGNTEKRGASKFVRRSICLSLPLYFNWVCKINQGFLCTENEMLACGLRD